MNIIKINSAESIIEAYYDGGESYVGHEKYSVFNDHYRVTIPEGMKATVKQGWMAVDTMIYSGDSHLIIERDCDLDVTDFDRVTLCALNGNVTVSIILTTDKGEQVALRDYTPEDKEFGGSFEGSRLTKIRFEVALKDKNNSGDLNLLWLALANSERLAFEEKGSGYSFSPEWDGCFKENYEIGPEIGIYFGKDELPAFKEKIKKAPFDKIYQSIKEEVYSNINSEPETLIEEYLINFNKFVCRVGHMHTCICEGLQNIALVAVIEEDRELVRLAGRILLSIAVTPHWCESFMGNLPSVTWHHRAFLEGLAAKRCAIALDLIGSSLTWHAKNLICDAIIQKGLPRVEADMFTMEYVRTCNQGVVFNNDRIFAYIALADRYPRYERMIDIAEDDFNEMVDIYYEDDGGSLEGPSYWSYTTENVVEAAIVLARYRKKTLQEFTSPRLKKVGDYVMAMLCRRPEGFRFMLLNDSYDYGQFSCHSLYFLYKLSGNKFLGSLVSEMLKKGGGLETLLLIDEDPCIDSMEFPEGLISLDTSGFATFRTRLQNGELLQLHITDGKANFSHFHEDKGQIVMHVGDEELLCDRGNVSALGRKPISHNMFVPESEGFPYSQLANESDGRVLYSKYDNGVLEYKTDLTGTWEKGIFENITREINSHKPEEYIITDSAVCQKDTPMSIRFHSVYPIEKQGDSFVITSPKTKLYITPVDYAADNFVIKEDGINRINETVNQLIIYLDKAKSYSLKTKLTVE